ncbi:NUDIX domain-containing protein [Streptacidiphilus fuscans]|uniref:NUDIX hydrolase n=1 Tax=Streptacidiphilus fuscans TaxID=2789292 RepID=A0A931B829_9ACTN|nr:NUDIX hydrolase [Streptacidiphilus fuscans]MBF9071861.1 NUDIX hydrolase [Streptacidiphilus fuscans]
MVWIPPEEFLKGVPRAVHGCGVLLFDESDRVLMLHDTPNAERDATGWSGRWLWAGGLLDLGEKPADAAIREVHEETGLTLTREDLRIIGVAFTPATSDWPTVTDYHFAGPVLSPEQIASIRLSDEHDAWRFAHAHEWRGIAQEPTTHLLDRLLAAHREGTRDIHFNTE